MLTCRDPFLDLSTLWYTDDPSVTSCMADTLLAFLPCLTLWLLAPVCLAYAPRSNREDVGAVSWGFWVKTAANVILVVAAVVDLGVRSVSSYVILC